MIVEMLSVLTVFLCSRDVKGALYSSSAAVFGLLISSMCLVFLLIAEIRRTCPEDLTRLLAATQDYYEPAAKEVECNPKFGERNEGLGTIEPFTSLIALSPLRFFLAFYVVRLFGSGASLDEDKDSHEGEHDHHHGPDPTSMVRDLWMASIGAHSNIARSFGLFSAELLQCMLGIYVEPLDANNDSSLAQHPETSDAKNEKSDIFSSKHHKGEKSVDATSNDSRKGEMSQSLPVQQLPDAPVIRDDRDDQCDDRFAFPKARLLRRMRRCEVRLLPLINEWEIVDVVITKHELILFDVESTPEDIDAIRTFTKSGGKQLQLWSIAKGRKVMSKVSEEMKEVRL